MHRSSFWQVVDVVTPNWIMRGGGEEHVQYTSWLVCVGGGRDYRITCESNIEYWGRDCMVVPLAVDSLGTNNSSRLGEVAGYAVSSTRSCSTARTAAYICQMHWIPRWLNYNPEIPSRS